MCTHEINIFYSPFRSLYSGCIPGSRMDMSIGDITYIELGKRAWFPALPLLKRFIAFARKGVKEK